MTKQFEILDASNHIRFADYTGGGAGSTAEPVIQIKNGVVVSYQAGLKHASDFTQIQRYKDGSIASYFVKHADGSDVVLQFHSTANSNYVQIGANGEKVGELQSISYASPTSLPVGETPFFVEQDFENGHLTKYDLQTNDGKAHLLGTYDVATQAATITLQTYQNSISTSGTGQIDALNKIKAASLIGQDGNGLIGQDGNGLKVITDHGSGLIGQDGNGWSVVSNDGGTFSLIGQDGNGLNLSNIAGLIGQDGNGLSATVTGNIVAQGGGNIVAQGGGNIADALDDLEAKVLIGADTASLIGLGIGSISTVRPSDLVANGSVVTQAVLDVGDYGAFLSNGALSLHNMAYQGAATPADLAITTAFLDHTTSGAPYHFGDTLNVSWGIKNVGQGITGPSTSAVYLSTDPFVSADDKLIGTAVDPQLLAGNSGSDTFSYHLPSSLAGGTYYIYTVANAVDHPDPKDNFSEDRTDNISQMLSFTLKSASNLPDLTIPQGALLVNDQSPNDDTPSGHAGDQIKIDFGVKEIAGNNATGNFAMGVYISDDASLSQNDALIGYTREYHGVNAGTMNAYEVLADLPQDLMSGHKYIFLVADDPGDGGSVGGVITEGSEQNNRAVFAFDVLPTPKPDLTVSSVTLAKTIFQAGEAIGTGHIDVKNIGAATQTTFTTELYISTDKTITTSDMPIVGVNAYGGLAAGEDKELDVTYGYIPANLAPGTYYIGAIADPNEQIGESNENNNASQGTGVVKITIVGDPSTPTITLDPVTGDDLVNGADLKAGVKVTGKTTGVENGQTVTVALEKSHGVPLVAAMAVVQGGAFSLTLPSLNLPSTLGSGNLFVSADVENKAGKSADAEHAFHYDLTGPKLSSVKTIVIMAKGGYNVSVNGIADKSAGPSVAIMQGATDLKDVAVSSGDGSWYYSGFIQGSSVKLSAVATDPAGNNTTYALLNASATGSVTGSKGADALLGDKHANILSGADGNDILQGGKGGDELTGGKGEDAAVYENASKGVTASLLKSGDNTGDAKGDIYSSIEDLEGSNHDDKLVGDKKINFLAGLAGADTFVFAAFNDKSDPDHVKDFHHAEHDHIGLDHKIFEGLKLTGSHHVDKTWFHDHIKYDADGGDLFYYRNGLSDKKHVIEFAQLLNHEHLSVSDFIVI